MSSNMVFILGFLVICFVYGWLAGVVGGMAEKRGRSYWGWWIFSIIFSCVLGAIVLLVLGDTENRRREKILEDEELRSMYRKQR